MGGVFGGQVVAAAMIDRIVHHADVLPLKGASYRLRDRGIDTLPSIRAEQGQSETARDRSLFNPPHAFRIRASPTFSRSRPRRPEV